MSRGLVCTQGLVLCFPSRNFHFVLLGFILPCFPNASVIVITFAVCQRRHDVHFNYMLTFTLFELCIRHNYIFSLYWSHILQYLQAFHVILKWKFSHLVSNIELAKEVSAAVWYPDLNAQKPLETSVALILKLQIQWGKASCSHLWMKWQFFSVWLVCTRHKQNKLKIKRRSREETKENQGLIWTEDMGKHRDGILRAFSSNVQMGQHKDAVLFKSQPGQVLKFLCPIITLYLAYIHV